jgi:acyl-CoA synthetase (AMP-forming)/AMP-acid ligase II
MNPMSRSSTLRELMSKGADDAPAITAPGTVPLSYRGLRALVEKTIASLNSFGVGRNDRVAIVLPNGPDMATAFIGIASGATAAPLNPSYKADEFEFYSA